MNFTGILLILMAISFTSFAEERISNHDLRKMKPIFSLSDMSEKKHKVYTLMTSAGGDFTMIYELGGKKLKQWKIDTSSAQVIDDKFADDFINMKYIMKQTAKAKCGKLYALELRGEKQSICKEESEKIGTVEKLITYISNNLNKR